MISSQPSLQELQEWMSILIRHAKDSRTGAQTKAARALLPLARVSKGDIVIPNDRMSVFQRLDVYNGGYFSRLKEVLESDFPGLIHALGEHEWFHLALGYVTRHPSEHPNLNVFNRNLPSYIDAKRDLPHRAFLRDLAQLEVHMSEAFDAPEFTPFDMESLLDLTPEQWEGAVFETNPSLRLLESAFPVNPYLQQVFDERDPEIPQRCKSWVAIFRKDYNVWRHNLPRPIYRILAALQSGKPLAESIAAGGEHGEDFQYWFREWSSDGLFTGVLIPRSSNT